MELFNDGDAARDVSHMNRLERGAYFDLIQAQRKFGGYTVEQARKILGKDFDEIWPSIEMVLTCENGKFFIQWVRDSMINRAEHAEKQRVRIQNYWDKVKKEEEERNIHGNTVVLPLENEDVIENEIAIENKKGKGRGENPEPEILKPKTRFQQVGDIWSEFMLEATHSAFGWEPKELEGLKKIIKLIERNVDFSKDIE